MFRKHKTFFLGCKSTGGFLNSLPASAFNTSSSNSFENLLEEESHLRLEPCISADLCFGWQSSRDDLNPWLTIDLGIERIIRAVTVRHLAETNSTAVISVSNNSLSWLEIIRANVHDLDTQNLEMSDVQARFVKVKLEEVDTPFPLSLDVVGCPTGEKRISYFIVYFPWCSFNFFLGANLFLFT